MRWEIAVVYGWIAIHVILAGFEIWALLDGSLKTPPLN